MPLDLRWAEQDEAGCSQGCIGLFSMRAGLGSGTGRMLYLPQILSPLCSQCCHCQILSTAPALPDACVEVGHLAGVVLVG